MSEYKYDFNYPEGIFKYFGLGRVEFFKNFSLRVTQRSSLNDPFEQLTVNRNGLSSLPDGERNSLYANCGNDNPHSSDLVKEILRRKIELEETISAGKLNKDKSGVICFTEIPDNLLMWAHYASDHRGFAVEFNSSYFLGNEIDGTSAPFSLLRVKYRDSRFEKQTTGLHEFFRSNSKNAIVTKSNHWGYEDEWRVVAALSNPLFAKKKDKNDCDVVDAFGNYIYLYKIPKKVIRRVIFGASCSIKDILFVKNIINADAELNHVKMKLAVIDDVEFKIRLVNIKNSDFLDIDEVKYAS